MVRRVKLYLIRHGETVDNVAGLYAGVRDSELTNHGYQQATRLGQHFMANGLKFTHLYSSHLQRAAKTAGKIREAQLASAGDETLVQAVPEVLQLPLLVEQDFGSMEGKKFYERPVDRNTTGKEHNRLENKGTPGFVDVESKDSMAQRADTFLNKHLLLVLNDNANPAELCIAIVSHGIFLSTLWKRLLLRLPPKSVALSAELQATMRPSLEHLGGWSNTGYLELSMIARESPDSITLETPSLSSTVLPTTQPLKSDDLGEVEVPQLSKSPAIAEKQAEAAADDSPKQAPQPSKLRIASHWDTVILTINGKDHLKGLKRTGGGVGSSRHDSSQKNIDSFFKRQRVEES